jgi:transcriptional regulator with XRE-family HTH domain
MGKDPREEYLKKFGENLKKIRKSKALSLRALSALCTIDYGDISKMEGGKINITILTVVELADALEVKPKKLLDFE